MNAIKEYLRDQVKEVGVVDIIMRMKEEMEMADFKEKLEHQTNRLEYNELKFWALEIGEKKAKCFIRGEATILLYGNDKVVERQIKTFYRNVDKLINHGFKVISLIYYTYYNIPLRNPKDDDIHRVIIGLGNGPEGAPGDIFELEYLSLAFFL